MRLPKDHQPWARTAERNGWTVTRQGSHIVWRTPDGHAVATSPSTAGGGRGTANLRATLRRAGLPV